MAPYLNRHAYGMRCNVHSQVAACEEDVDRFHATKAAAQAEAEEADAAAQQALETGHAEVCTTALIWKSYIRLLVTGAICS